MIERLRGRFAEDSSVSVIVHDLDAPIPRSLGAFEAVVSSFAIHHVTHTRKRALYEEVFALLDPGGVCCNLEHVSSPTLALHHQFLAAISYRPEQEDPSNKLLDVETQLAWLRRSVFRMWTAYGNGVSWRCSSATDLSDAIPATGYRRQANQY